MLSFGLLAFAAPWALVGLAALPGVWWLLRATPPAPRKQLFPAIAILRALSKTAEAPARTPWWLTALRLAAAAAAILGLAEPRWGEQAAARGDGPAIVVVDNGWAAAPQWPAIADAARRAIRAAEQDDRPVALALTAPGADGAAVQTPAFEPARRALARLGAAAPQPWSAERRALADALRGAALDGAPESLWFADGVAAPGTRALADALGALGPLTVTVPARRDGVIALRRAGTQGGDLAFELRRLETSDAARVTIEALDSAGRAIAAADAVFAAGDSTATARIDGPRGLRNRIADVRIPGAGAAGTALADDRWARRAAGLLVEPGAAPAQPLLSEEHYIRRALQPEIDVVEGDLARLRAAGVGVVFIPDGAGVAREDEDALIAFARAGGGVVRFAGPRLANAAALGAADADPLSPGPLRAHARRLGGAMSWSAPAELAPFPTHGPFAGLRVPPEAKVRRQLLSDPGADTEVWARLEDGTPLVTVRPEGDGFVALIHVTADPLWSDLPLTDAYVGMLRRITQLGAGAPAGDARAPLGPEAALDGFGRLGPPGPAAKPFDPRVDDAHALGPSRPPGLYAGDGRRRALSLGAAVLADPGSLTAMTPIDGARWIVGDARAQTTSIGGGLLALALALLLVDAAASFRLRGLALRAAAVVLAFGLGAADGRAQPTDDALVAAATRTRLAWIETSDPQSDAIAAAGLRGLSETLTRRTAVDAADPVGVDAATDPLALYPLIYWRATARAAPLSPDAVAALNAYMRNGGALVVDVVDGDAGALRQAAGLDAPALARIGPTHVLTRAFYLMRDFPGRRVGGALWVERDEASDRDGVSAIIVGENDFAGAWAVDERGRPVFPVSPGGERQREMALRFGVNLVMYALTGNYKADQVHVPAILERLGQ